MTRRKRRYKIKEGIVGDILFLTLEVGGLLLWLIFAFPLLLVKNFFEGLLFGTGEAPIQEINKHEADALARQLEEVYNKAVDRLRTLVGYTENKLYYQIVKTEFPGFNRIREYVNFFTYDRETVALENANELVNTVLHNVLGVYKGKSKKLHNTIVLEDYACDMKDISRNLSKTLDVEEIQMLMS